MEVIPHEPNSRVERAIARLREATQASPYEGRLYLVGGLLRDRAMGLPLSNDLDLVLEGEAIPLALFLHSKGLSSHHPVLYPRFGTAMIHLGDGDESSMVELVSARAESYEPDSRKPKVWEGSLRDDVFRRDFTINTLLENLHTGEILDLTGQAWDDLRAGIIRTPKEARLTFFDDPLRMLRAVRFAARFGFEIEAETWKAVCAQPERLRPPAIAHERIREELVKILKLPGRQIRRGLELLLEAQLLDQFLPEMRPMVGCTQRNWHRYDVWEHTLLALEHLPDHASLEVRLGLLWHDVGKPATRSVLESGSVRFYGHPTVGATLTETMMQRLKFSNEEIRDVTALVRLHMRLGEYRPEWPDATIKRLMRDCGPSLDDLFLLAQCDRAAVDIPPDQAADLAGLRQRIEALNAQTDVLKIASPLDGVEIMQFLGTGQGPHLRDAKNYLIDRILEGDLAEGDKEAARQQLKSWWQERMA